MYSEPIAILVCGKLCSGKSTYTRQLRKERGAVVLSCDELVLSILGNDLGDRHDEILLRVKEYLYTKAAEILDAGVGVILEWGFWKKAERDYAKRFFSAKGYACELHYIDVTDEQWTANIENRNRAVAEGTARDYFVDEGLLKKLEGLFEIPDPDEVDTVVCIGEK